MELNSLLDLHYEKCVKIQLCFDPLIDVNVQSICHAVAVSYQESQVNLKSCS